MSTSTTALRAVTVGGLVSGDSLGIVLPHEHVTIDNSSGTLPRPGVDPDQTVALSQVGATRAWPRSRSDNLILDRDDLVTEELVAFRSLGGGTIVEMTTAGNGRDLSRLEAVSAASGVSIVATTGCYVGSSHAREVVEGSVDQLTDLFVDELRQGTVRCGAIGEIGLSREPSKQEWKGLEAALAASDETGAPIWIHITTLQPLERLLDWLKRRQQNTERVVICHMDHELKNLELHRRALDMGLTVEFDLFGLPVWTGGPFLHAPTDTDRLEALIGLAESGWATQLLMSHDVCQKIQLKVFGGFGYGHILENVKPLFERLNAPTDLFTQISVETPRRLLAWATD